MTKTEKKLTLQGVDMVSLLGVNDRNLTLVEKRFPDSIVAVRGENVVIRGPENEVKSVEKAVKEMAYTLNVSGALRENDVSMILDLAEESGEISPDREPDDVAYYGKEGAVKARTPGQKRYLTIAKSHDVVFAVGPAGTGKTYLAVALAAAAFKRGEVKKIMLARPAVEAGESLGFLPGDFREKVDPYLRPLYDALDDMMPTDRLRALIERGVIEIVPLAYMRGRTLNKAFVILDEAQNTTDIQMKMFLTRIGANSRAIVTGDVTQIDLKTRAESGLVRAQEILKDVEGIGFVYFGKQDVVRHRLVKEIIDAYEKFYDDEED
jgi:phosphate starvation-inducible protein PhoH and related proteins